MMSTTNARGPRRRGGRDAHAQVPRRCSCHHDVAIDIDDFEVVRRIHVHHLRNWCHGVAVTAPPPVVFGLMLLPSSSWYIRGRPTERCAGLWRWRRRWGRGHPLRCGARSTGANDAFVVLGAASSYHHCAVLLMVHTHMLCCYSHRIMVAVTFELSQ